MPKIAIVGLSLFSVLALLLLLTLPKGGTVQQFVRPNNESSGNAQPSLAGSEVDRDVLRQIKSSLSSIEARLQALEQRPKTPPPGFLPAVSAPLPTLPPLQLPDGSEAPWAWIEKLDPGKKASVERAFEAAVASARSRMPPPGVAPDDLTLEAARENLDREVAGQLRSILSPQEFEAYLSSLPAGLRTRIEAETSGSR
jgi:hypothetical protein